MFSRTPASLASSHTSTALRANRYPFIINLFVIRFVWCRIACMLLLWGNCGTNIPASLQSAYSVSAMRFLSGQEARYLRWNHYGVEHKPASVQINGHIWLSIDIVLDTEKRSWTSRDPQCIHCKPAPAPAASHYFASRACTSNLLLPA